MPCPPSSRAPDRGRRCLCLFCAAPAGCTCCAPPCAPLFRERRAVEPRPHVWAKPYPLVRAFVLHCRSLWVCSRSAEHVVSAATQIAANKNMHAAAAQSEASFMPALCSHNHVHCNIFMNSWPLRCGPKGRNACMIAFTSGPNSQDFTLCKLACPVHAAESMTDGSLGLRASLGLALSPCMVCSLLGAVPPPLPILLTVSPRKRLLPASQISVPKLRPSGQTVRSALCPARG